MSLVAYEKYLVVIMIMNANKRFMHVNSIKAHKGLSVKDYHKLPGVTSLDYVLMFILLSPYLVAIGHSQTC